MNYIQEFRKKYVKNTVGYHLIDPRTEEPFYVGITTDASTRMRTHKRNKECNKQHKKRIRDIHEAGLQPRMIIVIENMTHNEAIQWEPFEVDKLKDIRYELTNSMYSEGNGTKHSEETKRKIGEASKGRRMTEANKQILILISTGRPSVRAGIKVSEETKQSMRRSQQKRRGVELQLGISRSHTEETKRKIGEASKQRRHTKETKRKLSEKAKGRKMSKEAKRKIGEANKRRIVSKETRQKMSNSHKKRAERRILSQLKTKFLSHEK